MRIVTWNVNSLKARLARVEAWIVAAEPDVLCLQETKMADEAFPHGAFAALGYESAHHGEGRWNGVAVISIWPGLVKSENRLVHAETQPDGRVTLFGLDLSYAETPHFPGRAVVALASDDNRMARTGHAFWVADLAREYGFTDIDGSIPDAEKLHEQLKRGAPEFWRDVIGT